MRPVRSKVNNLKNLEEYVPVHKRVELFRKDHPLGRIVTHLIGGDPVSVRAEIYVGDDTMPVSTAHANEDGGLKNNRKDSTLEKVETAAVGRALAFLGYEIKQGIASKEDIIRMNERQEARTALKVAPASGLERKAPSEDELAAGKYLKDVLKLTAAQFREFKEWAAGLGGEWVRFALEARDAGVKKRDRMYEYFDSQDSAA